MSLDLICVTKEAINVSDRNKPIKYDNRRGSKIARPPPQKGQDMILTNQRTQEELKLTHAEFLSKFHKELQDAFASYRKSALAKSYYKHLDEATLESDFYHDLQWNFNHLSNSVWCIKKL